MKWIKHHTDANRDEKLLSLKDEFGLEGYAVYWLILESIAEQMTKKRPSPELELSHKNWRKITEISPKKLKKFALFCHISQLFIVTFSEKSISIKCPKLLEIKDEWQSRINKNSGVTPDQVRASASVSVSSYKDTSVSNTISNACAREERQEFVHPDTGKVYYEN